MATIISVPLSNQIQVPFINMRSIYQIRERPSRIFSWTALVTSQFLTELPWNVLGSSLFFLCWYWTVDFGQDRTGYTYLMMGIVFPLYYTSIGKCIRVPAWHLVLIMHDVAMAVAAMAPNATLAGLLFSFLFSFVLTL